MRVLGRLLMALAVVLPCFVLAATAANGSVGSGDGTAVMKCMHWKDAMVITPGVTNTPADQTVVAHGRVYGCNKVGGGGKFDATLHLTAATCSGLALEGVGNFDWTNGQHSTATLQFQQQAVEPKKFLVGGVVTSGVFDTLLVQAWLRFTFVFNGTGAPCSATNPLQHIDFTNSQSLQLFTPVVPTTTTFIVPTTTAPQQSTTTAEQTSVPVTTAGSTVPVTHRTTTVPVTARCVCPVGSTTPTSGIGGSLAFTGSSSGALVGLESVLVGGALACFGQDRRRRRVPERSGMKSWLEITMPPGY